MLHNWKSCLLSHTRAHLALVESKSPISACKFSDVPARWADHFLHLFLSSPVDPRPSCLVTDAFHRGTSTAPSNVVTMLLLRVFSLLSLALPSVLAQASSDAASELAALSKALPPCGVRQRAFILVQAPWTLTDPFLAVAEMFYHRTGELEMHRCGVCV